MMTSSLHFFFVIEYFSSATGGKGCLLEKFFYAFLCLLILSESPFKVLYSKMDILLLDHGPPSQVIYWPS